MPLNRIIPSLLLHEGRLVKGARFSDYRDAGAPETTARAHSAQSADEILLLDIDASRLQHMPDFATLSAVALEVQVPLTFGGGLVRFDFVVQAFDSGADKICLTTTAYEHPQLIEDVAQQYGTQAVMVGVDVITDRGNTYVLYDHRTRQPYSRLTLDLWLSEIVNRGAGEIRLCSVAREGTRAGADLSLYRYVRERVRLPIIYEGGIGSLEHLREAMDAGVDSVALGSLLVFSDNNLVKVRRYLQGAKLAMRP